MSVPTSRSSTRCSQAACRRLDTNTNQYNFTYNQGFVTGTALQVGLQNSRTTSDNLFDSYSPSFQSIFKATVTQHLLQGAGIWINKRFIYQAQNNRKITDSSFRQQILLHREPGGDHLLGPGAGL